MWRALVILACAPACDLVFTVKVPADAGPSMHDEDQDGLFDDVDDCPTVKNPPTSPGAPQDDLDGDGVGDACDPHPDVAGDELLTVEYFDTGFGSVWTPDADDWTVSLDSVTSPVPPAIGAKTHGMQRQTLQAKVATLEMGYEVLAIGPPNNNNNVEIIVNTPGDEARCQVQESLADGSSRLNLSTSRAGTGTDFTPEVADGQTLVLRLTRDAPENVCTVGTTRTTLTNADPRGVIVNAAVDLLDTQIRINYIAIYQVK